MKAPGGKSRRLTLSARLSGRAKLESHASGAITAYAGEHAVNLGTFSRAAWGAVQELAAGMPLASLSAEGGSTAKEIDVLVRRLAGIGLLEYRAGYSLKSGEDLLVIEPQVPGYWPQMTELADGDWVILSRFAYMRRRECEIVLESPRASALFCISEPKAAGFVAMLSAPQQVGKLRKQDGFPGVDFLGLLVDCGMAFKTGSGARSGTRWAEGDNDLALWDFHDLLFHARSTEGRHANPVGGTYPHGGTIPQPPAERPSWPGEKIDLCPHLKTGPEAEPPIVKLLRERVSIRSFDDRRPVTLAELSKFLDGAARATMRKLGGKGDNDFPPGLFPPYATGGASYELELYLAVSVCDGLPRGFYHYDCRAHALVPIEVPARELKTMLERGTDAMGTQAAPQILITIAARFGRVSWKYSALAYSLILKDAGILTQNLYLMATAMELGGCAIGLANIDHFEKLTGIDFHMEGPVGQFALGRCAPLKDAG